MAKVLRGFVGQPTSNLNHMEDVIRKTLDDLTSEGYLSPYPLGWGIDTDVDVNRTTGLVSIDINFRKKKKNHV